MGLIRPTATRSTDADRSYGMLQSHTCQGVAAQPIVPPDARGVVTMAMRGLGAMGLAAKEPVEKGLCAGQGGGHDDSLRRHDTNEVAEAELLSGVRG
jgi:hypothetical protein